MGQLIIVSIGCDGDSGTQKTECDQNVGANALCKVQQLSDHCVKTLSLKLIERMIVDSELEQIVVCRTRREPTWSIFLQPLGNKSTHCDRERS